MGQNLPNNLKYSMKGRDALFYSSPYHLNHEFFPNYFVNSHLFCYRLFLKPYTHLPIAWKGKSKTTITGGNWRLQDKVYSAARDGQASSPHASGRAWCSRYSWRWSAMLPGMERGERGLGLPDAIAYLPGQGQAGCCLSSSCCKACRGLWHLTGICFSGVLWHKRLSYRGHCR